MNDCGAFSTYVQLDGNQIYLSHIDVCYKWPLYDCNIHTVSVFLAPIVHIMNNISLQHLLKNSFYHSSKCQNNLNSKKKKKKILC